MIKAIIFLVSALLILGVFISVFLNIKYDKDPNAKIFENGSFPSENLDGNYKGEHFYGLGKNWTGKYFDAKNNTGINNFKNEKNIYQNYSFVTSKTKGLRNKNNQVLQLNYAVDGNPLWLKFIKDEVVEIEPGKFVGKIHIKFGPFVTTMGYFKLSK